MNSKNGKVGRQQVSLDDSFEENERRAELMATQQDKSKRIIEIKNWWYKKKFIQKIRWNWDKNEEVKPCDFYNIFKWINLNFLISSKKYDEVKNCLADLKYNYMVFNFKFNKMNFF